MVNTRARRDKKMTDLEKKNAVISYKIAKEAIVLLKNNGVLPLTKENRRLALYGAGAKMTVKGGSGSGEVNERHAISIYEGLVKAGFTISSEEWLKDYDEEYKRGKAQYKKEFFKGVNFFDRDAVEEMVFLRYGLPEGRNINEEDIISSETDTCIYVISRQTGEGNDGHLNDGTINLTEIERDNIEICASAYKKCIIVLNVGSYFDTSELERLDGVNAIIHMCQLGLAGGRALADVITGKVNPSGKLSATWPKKYEDVPFANEYSYFSEDGENAYHKEGIYVGYRYYDSFMVEPRYEFGYGLSYTDFEYGLVKSKLENYNGISFDNGVIRLKCYVKNVGDKFSGKETLQLYMSEPSWHLNKAYQKLVAFKKTDELAPGEVQEIELSFDLADFGSYHEKLQITIIEAGVYALRLGNSSRNTTVVATFEVEEFILLGINNDVCKCSDNMASLQEIERVERDAERILGDSKLVIKRDDVDRLKLTKDNHVISFPDKVERFVKKASVENLVELVVGDGMLPKEPYLNVPGAAGYTTSKFAKKGFPNLVMADGPAGLRLIKRSGITKSGKIKPIDMPMEAGDMAPEPLKKMFLANPKHDEVVYQFATAFPIGMALAQTWNTDLIYNMGEAVSSEMTEYGVTYWLAPGMNIMRNPLCGRNYEYFSEDPVLTAECAIALTMGVEATPGNYVTIKHFVANTQEYNRYTVSENVSSRALREIYLKSFELTIKKARPHAIMTAYNAVNHVPCCMNSELLVDILRKEWNYEGLVMTDWYSTRHLGKNADVEALKAGVDIIMPGSKDVKRRILDAVKNGKLDREILERRAGMVLTEMYKKRLRDEKS